MMAKKFARVSDVSDIQKRLKANAAQLKELKIRSLMIFGSFARGEQTSESDIDLLVEFSKPVGLFHFFDVQTFLESLLGRKVDLAVEDSIKPEMIGQIRREMVRAS